MITTIVFDLDGTLLDTLEDLTDSVNYALKKLGFPQRTIDEIRSFVGNGIANLIARVLPDGNENPRYDEVLKPSGNIMLCIARIKQGRMTESCKCSIACKGMRTRWRSFPINSMRR